MLAVNLFSQNLIPDQEHGQSGIVPKVPQNFKAVHAETVSLVNDEKVGPLPDSFHGAVVKVRSTHPVAAMRVPFLTRRERQGLEQRVPRSDLFTSNHLAVER
jgi:hypothetical protein